LKFPSHVSIGQLIDDNVELFNINRITQESNFYLLFVFVLEAAEKIVL